jgi:uncharacterized protein
MEKNIVVKIHKTYRLVVAICDEDIKGKSYEEGEKVLNLSTKFFEGDLVSLDELRDIIVKSSYDDATFYIVGEKSVEFAKSVGLISVEGILNIEGVPYALILL